jgi:hypothetical protein
MNVYEREFLLKDKNPHEYAFKERSVSKLATLKAPVNILNIEANHVKRTNLKSHPNGIVPLLEYQLWLEAGKLKLDSKNAEFGSENGLGGREVRGLSDETSNSLVNSNIWRNFKSSCGFSNNKKGNVSESIALLYPINIPSPSRLSSTYTLSDYFRENKKKLFKTDKTFNLLLKKYESENALMKYLKLKSDMRRPPLDRLFSSLETPTKSIENINELDVKTFRKKKISRGIVSATIDSQQRLQTTPITQFITSHQKVPSKISYRQTHPDYDRVLFEQQVKGNV